MLRRLRPAASKDVKCTEVVSGSPWNANEDILRTVSVVLVYTKDAHLLDYYNAVIYDNDR